MSKQLRITPILLGIVAISLIAVYSNAQTSSGGYKFDEFDPATEDPILFEKKAKTFLKALAESGADTRGEIYLYSNDPLAKILYELAGAKLANRLQLQRPGVRSHNSPKTIEFWIVPYNSEGPFPVSCGLCECPSLSVDGKAKFGISDIELNFTANVTGGADIKYNWKVTGGEITEGQGTSSIVVKPNFFSDVTATVEIDGLDASCNCQTEASASSVRDN